MMRNLLVVLMASGAALAANPVKDAVPLFFIANHGQAPPAVRFMAKGSGLTAYFSPREALFRVAGSTVRMQFEKANASPRIEGMERLPGHANFLLGAQRDWRADVPVYGAVAYRELYPGIDMVYGGEGRNLKSEFVVAPGADPLRIRVRYAGAGSVRIEASGALAIAVDGRELREQAPSIYQERSGKRVAVEGRFAVDDDGTVRFLVGDYDVGRPLIIDPVLSYSTLLGGSGFDTATALAVDSAGAAYVAGYTESYNFPTANPEQNFNAGGNDAFVAKLNPSGNGLVYCTYVGGSGDDRAYGIAVDGNGSAYVTGSTLSGNFPVRNALQPHLAGGRNAFVLKLNPAGNTLVYSTYLGGNASDNGNGIAVDAGGNAYVVGDTTSINFPASGMQRGNHGGQDAFVAKLSADGSRLLYSTYLGGGNDDRGAGIAVDGSGSAYVTGSTYSADFPVASAFQSRNGGGQDAFIARLSADGNSLVFSTYLGGTGGIAAYPEAGQGIALDSQGSAYVTGMTSSANFPLLNAVQTSLHGSTDAFVAKVSASGGLVYSTYLGGSSMDVGNAIAVDASGGAYVVGYSYSTDLPVTASALQASNAGDCDAFLAKLSAAGGSLAYLSYLGGSSSDTATAVALDNSGNVYVAGWTLSTNFPLLNPYQSTNAGNYGAFVSKMILNLPPTVVGVAPSSGNGASQTFSFQFADANGASDLTSVSVLFNAALSTANACSVTYNPAQNTLSLLTDAGAVPGTITPGSGSQQNSQCTLAGAGSSVTASGATLTVNLSLSFPVAFDGAKNVYMQATNAAASTGWQLKGSWQVGPAVAAQSVMPAQGSGLAQSFTLVYTDVKGASDLTSAQVIIAATQTTVSSCYMWVTPVNGTIWLANDASGWSSPYTLGGGGTIQNSQCGVNVSASGGVSSGNTYTLTLAMTFQGGYAGSKNVYGYATTSGGANSGWQTLGTWLIPAPAPAVSAVSVTPAQGSGMAQSFTLVYTDAKGASDLTSAQVIMAATQAMAGSCYVWVNPVNETIWLANDADTGWSSPYTLGSGGTTQNSQCGVNVSASAGVASGNTYTLTLAMTFQAGYAGSKNVYGYATASGGANSGWQTLGTWLVSTPAPAPAVSAVSVTPAQGSGTAQSFTLVYTDAKGASDLTSAQAIIAATEATVSSCYVWVTPANGTIWLANDAYTGWSSPYTLGGGGTIQNSQCGVNVSASSGVASGNTYTLTLAMTFQGGYAGSKNVYGYATTSGGANSGWQTLGTWLVPPPASLVSAVSVTPAQGSGMAQSFTLVYTDAKGASDLTSAQVIIAATQATTSSCYVWVTPVSGTIWLANNATGWSNAYALGSGGTIQNSQCGVNVSASGGVASGNTYTLTLAMTFQAGYAGSKNVYGYATTSGGANSGWPALGTWNVP